MVIPDINLLLYAHDEKAIHHEKARDWWQELLSGTTPVAVPWIVSSGFIRIATQPRILNEPLSAAHAVSLVRQWLERPNVIIIGPGDRFAGLFLGFLEGLGTAGNLTTDAQLAALAVEHQAEIHSNDTDFHRFPGLRWRNPLKRS